MSGSYVAESVGRGDEDGLAHYLAVARRDVESRRTGDEDDAPVPLAVRWQRWPQY